MIEDDILAEINALVSRVDPLSGLGMHDQRDAFTRGMQDEPSAVYGGWEQKTPPPYKPDVDFRKPVDNFNPPTLRRHPFEAYIIGYTSTGMTTASVQVYTGTVLNDEEDITDTITIANIDSTFELVSGDWLYLDTDFDSNGDITTCSLAKASSSGWTGYPSLSPSSTKWIQPICHVRAFKSSKAGGGVPDSGEWAQIESNLFISQKTTTHLVKMQACIGGALKWKLVPGVGGVG